MILIPLLMKESRITNILTLPLCPEELWSHPPEPFCRAEGIKA
jgi:hypothetical protein